MRNVVVVASLLLALQLVGCPPPAIDPPIGGEGEGEGGEGEGEAGEGEGEAGEGGELPGADDCGNLIDDDGDGFTDCDDVVACDAAAACARGSAPLGDPCAVASDCDLARPLCRSELASGSPGGACTSWCTPESADCGADAFCFGELPSRGECVPRCDPAGAGECRDAYACAPFQIVENGAIVDIGICVPACNDDADCAETGACFDNDGQFLSGRCVAPEVCAAEGGAGVDEDQDGRVDCEDDECGALPACDTGPVCAAPVAALVVSAAAPLVVTGDTADGSALFSGSCTGNFGGRELVYDVVAGEPGQTGVLNVEIGGGPDLGAYVRTSCDDAVSELGCADNASSEETELAFFNVVGGSTQTLFVDSIGVEEPGAFSMTLTFVPDVCGDGLLTGLERCEDAGDPPADGDGCSATCQPELDVLCENAIALAEGGGVVGDASDSASAFFQGSCTFPENSAREDVYVFTAAASGAARVQIGNTTGNTDLAIYVRTACDDATTEVACADETTFATPETLDFQVQAGTTYFVFIDGTLSAFDVGPYVVTLTLPD